MTTITTQIGREHYGVRTREVGDATSRPIERLTEDGWDATGSQMADYAHDLEAELVAGGERDGEDPAAEIA